MAAEQSRTDDNEEESGGIEAPAVFLALPSVLKEDGGSGATLPKEHLSSDETTTTKNKGSRDRRNWTIGIGLVILAMVVAAVGLGVALTKDSESNNASTSSSLNNSGIALQGDTDGDDNNGDNLMQSTSGSNSSSNQTVVQQEEDGTELTTLTPTTIIIDTPLANGRQILGIILEQGFDIERSYQSTAFQWLVNNTHLEEHSKARILQRYALACLYFATNGVANGYEMLDPYGESIVEPEEQRWLEEDGWLIDDDECEWLRITCTSDGRVSELRLHQNRLTGKLPAELALLKYSLEVLDVYQNQVHNSGPDEHAWLQFMTNLKVLVLGRTKMEYDTGIPTAIGKLSNLIDLDCSSTLYSGALQGETFAGLSSLEWLRIDNNSFGSSIPTELIALPSLQYFYANDAGLVDDISFVVDMPSIIDVSINDNPGLEGDASVLANGPPSLVSLSMTNSSVTGIIPSEACATATFAFGCSVQLCGCRCEC